MHKSIVLLGAGGGGKVGKEDIMEVLVNNLGPTTSIEEMVASSIEVSMVGMTWSSVANPCRS